MLSPPACGDSGESTGASGAGRRGTIKIREVVARLIRENAPKGGLVRAGFALGGATVVSQAVGVLLSPVYTRLYSPADYGTFGVYNSIVTGGLTIGSLCYETAIPVAKDDSEALRLVAIALLFVAVVGLGATGCLGVGTLAGWTGSERQLGAYLWLVPAGIVGAGLYQAVRYWALRVKAMGAIARTSISQLVSSTLLTLGFGILHPSPLGLMLAGIAGSSAGTWGLVRRGHLLPRMREEGRSGLASEQLRATAFKYQRLPLVATPSTLFNSASAFLPGILLAPYFGVTFAGQFFMGMRVVALPTRVIGSVLSQIFFSGCAAVARERPPELSRFYHRFALRAAASSLPILLAGLVAPLVVPILFGERWREAGEIALWLSLSSAVSMPVSALSAVPNIVGRLRGQFVIDVLRAIGVFLVLLFGHQMGVSGVAVVKAYAVVMSASALAYYGLYNHQVKVFAATGVTGWEAPAARSI